MILTLRRTEDRTDSEAPANSMEDFEGKIVTLVASSNNQKTYNGVLADAQMVYEYLGYKVFTPSGLPNRLNEESYLKIVSAMIEESDGVVMVGNWRGSAVANKLFEHAVRSGKTIMYYGRKRKLRSDRQTNMVDGEEIF